MGEMGNGSLVSHKDFSHYISAAWIWGIGKMSLCLIAYYMFAIAHS